MTSKRPLSPQAGAAMVEFALALLIYSVGLVAVVELARFMVVFNTAAEATRLASRLASICDMGAAQEAAIRAKVRYFVEASGQISVGSRSNWLVLTYSPTGCTPATCVMVEAKLSQLQAHLMIPASALTLDLPVYRSPQLREAMRNVVAGEFNPRCGS